MSIAPLDEMTPSEVREYVEALEYKVRELTQKTDNRKKLSAGEVNLMRRMWVDGDRTQTELADIFAINRATVSRIVRGEYFAELRMSKS